MAIGYLPPPPPRASQSLRPKPLEAIKPLKRKALPPIPKTLLTQGQIAAGQARVEAVSRELTNQQVQGADYLTLQDDSATSNINAEFDKLSSMLDSGQPISSAMDSEGTNPFMKVLGGLGRTLAYIDIPFELGVEVIEGAIPGKWWGEGTAERQDFEGWKALGKMFSGEQGLISTANEIADAFEKRPLMAQLGIGLVGGVGVGSLGRISYLRHLAGGKALKPIQYTLDPGQILWDVGAKGVKAGVRKIRKPKVPRPPYEPDIGMPTLEDLYSPRRGRFAWSDLPAGSSPADMGNDGVEELKIWEKLDYWYAYAGDEAGSGIGRTPLLQEYSTFQEMARRMGIPWTDKITKIPGEATPRRRTLAEIKKIVQQEHPDRYPFLVDKLDSVHRVDNSLKRLRRKLAGTEQGFDSLDAGNIDSSLITDNEARRLMFGAAEEVDHVAKEGNTVVHPGLARLRNLAMIDIQQASTGRAGELERMTLDELEDFIEKGVVNLEQITGQAVGGRAIQTVASGITSGIRYQANVSAMMYREMLKETIDSTSGLSMYELMKRKPNISVWDVAHGKFIKTGGKEADQYKLKSMTTGLKWATSIKAENPGTIIFTGDGRMTPAGKKFMAGKDFKQLKDEGLLEVVGQQEITRGTDAPTHNTLLLTNWLRNYNRHWAGVMGHGNVLPESGQFLRAQAANIKNAGDSALPSEVASTLGHSIGSGETFLTYLWDADSHKVGAAVRRLFGTVAHNIAPDSGETAFEQGGMGWLESVSGMKTKGYRTKDGVITEKQRAEGFVELTKDRNILLNLDETIGKYGGSKDDIIDFDADILGLSKDDIIKGLREMNYPEVTDMVLAGKGVTGGRKGMRVKGRTFLVKEMDDLAYVFMNLAHKRILTQQLKGVGSDLAPEVPFGSQEWLQSVGRTNKVINDNDFNLWRDLTNDDEKELIHELGAFLTLRDDVIQSAKHYWRADMHRNLVKSILAKSGWLERVGKQGYKLRTNAAGELEAFRGTGGGKVSGTTVQGMDAFVKHHGGLAEIDASTAWRLFGGFSENLKESPQILNQLGEANYKIGPEDASQSLKFLDSVLRRSPGQLHDHEMGIIGTWGVQQRLLQKVLNYKGKRLQLDGKGYQGILDDKNIMNVLTDGVREFEGEQEIINHDWLKVLQSIGGGYSEHVERVNAGGAGLAWGAIGRIIKYAIDPIPRGEVMLLEHQDISVPEHFKVGTEMVRRWLGSGNPITTDSLVMARGQEVVGSLALAGIVRDTPITYKKYMAALEKVFIRSKGSYFGSDVTSNAPELRIKEPQVQLRLSNIAKILMQDDSILSDSHFPRKIADIDFNESSVQQGLTIRRAIPRRKMVFEEGVTLNLGGGGVNGGAVNVTSRDFVARIPYALDFSNMVRAAFQETRFGRHMLGLDASGEPIPNRSRKNKVMSGVARALGGGAAQGGVSRIVKLFIGRKKMHGVIDQARQDSKAQIQLVLNEGTGPQGELSLGFTTEKATEFQKTRNIAKSKEGHQFFSKLKVSDIEIKGQKVIGWVDRTKEPMSDDLRKLLDETWLFVQRNHRAEGTTEGLWMGRATIQEGTEVTEHASLVADFQKALTLVDVPLRYLHIEDIQRLYDLNNTQFETIKLLRNIPEHVDNDAAARGYNIPEEVKKMQAYLKKKGELPAEGRFHDYAKEGYAYIPWQTRQDIGLRAEQAVKNSVEGPWQSWLYPVSDDNIWAMMGRGDVMDDVAERYAYYMSGVQKTVIDRELGEALNAHFLSLVPSKFIGDDKDRKWKTVEDNRKALRHLADVIENRGMPGGSLTVSVGPDDLDKLVTAKFADWDWAGADLRRHLSGIFRPSMTVSPQEAIMGQTGMQGGIYESSKYIKENYDDIKHAINSHEKEFNDFVGQTTVNVEEYLTGKFGLTGKKLEAEQWINNKLRLNQDDVDEIAMQLRPLQEGLSKPFTAAAGFAMPIARLMRVVKAGLDLGVMMIHGFNAMTRMPVNVDNGKMVWDFSSQKAWKDGFGNMLKMAWNPDYLDTYMAQPANRDLRRRMGAFVELGGMEPLEAGRASDVMKRMRVRLADGWFGPVRLMHRAEAAFVGGLDSMRMQMWEALEPVVRREYDTAARQDVTIKPWVNGEQFAYQNASKEQVHALTELGASINKMTGVYDKNMAGLTPTQGLIENAFLFFAPTYRRAVYGIIGDLLRRNAGDITIDGVTKRITTVRNREALRQLSGLVVAGGLFAGAAEFVFGNEGAANPTKGSFAKFDVGGASLGIGTAWYTVFRLAGDLALATQADPEGDVYELLKDHPLITALGRRGRSQASPVATFITDVVHGSTFMGDPLRDPDGSQDWSALLAHSGASFAYPFWLDGVFTAGAGGSLDASNALVAVSELFGLQSYPTSSYDKYLSTRQWVLANEDSVSELNVWRNARRASGESLDWDKLPNLLKVELQNGSIPLVEAYNEYKDEWGERARGDDRLWVQYSRRKGQIDLQSKQQLANWTTQFEKGLISGRDLTQKIKEVKNYRRTAHQDIFADPQFHPIMDTMNKRKKEGNDTDDFRYQGDIIYDAYLTDVIAAEDNLDEEGNWLIDNYKRNLGNFKDQWNMYERPELWKYVQNKKNHWYSDNTVMQDLESSKTILEPYWNMHNTIFVGEERRMAQKYMSAPTALQKAILKAGDRRYVDLERKLKAARVKYRKANPYADAYLVKYHGARPSTNAASNLEQRWHNSTMHAQSTGSVTTLSASGYNLSPAGRVLHSSLTDEL